MVSVIAPSKLSLLGLISTVIPSVVGGNTIVALASEEKPLCSISFAEVIHASDVPGGVINILTGLSAELVDHFSTHMDVNAIIYGGTDAAFGKTIQQNATHNLKRVLFYTKQHWEKQEVESPYAILDTQEIKTTWHPIGI